MKEITQADIQRISRCMRSVFYKCYCATARAEDFEAAGLLGLVKAAHEYDPTRAGWGTLSRWRAIEEGRQLLKWSMRTDADLSLDHSMTFSEKKHLEDYVGKNDEDGWFETEEMIVWLLEFVTGKVKKEIAKLAWLEKKNITFIAKKLNMKLNTVSSHLAYARQQAFEAIQEHEHWQGSALSKVCYTVESAYNPMRPGKRSERSLCRDKQHIRAQNG